MGTTDETPDEDAEMALIFSRMHGITTAWDLHAMEGGLRLILTDLNATRARVVQLEAAEAWLRGEIERLTKQLRADTGTNR